MVFALFPGLQIHWTLRKTIALFVKSLLVPNHHWSRGKPTALGSDCPSASLQTSTTSHKLLMMPTIRPILCLMNQTLKRKDQKSVIYQAFLVVLMHHEARETPSHTNAEEFELPLAHMYWFYTHASTTALSTCILFHRLSLNFFIYYRRSLNWFCKKFILYRMFYKFMNFKILKRIQKKNYKWQH